MAVAKKKAVSSIKTKKVAPAKAKVTVKPTKPTAKIAKKVVIKKPNAATEVGQASLKIAILNAAGKVIGSVSLPENIFGVKPNKQLIAQAVRVYLVNQRQGTVSTKTRGEVDGSTRKIYRQKGTGRARHGGIRAPIFVKGGIAHGPKPKDYSLSFPTKMKQKALISALSGKAQTGGIKVVGDIEKLDMKTKEFATALKNWGFEEKKRNAIFVLPKDMADIYKAMRNLAGITITTAKQLNTYDVLRHNTVIFMKDAVDALEAKLSAKGRSASGGK